MRFQLQREGWAIGQRYAEPGTIIDANNTDEFTALARGRTPPMHSLCLDQAAADLMFKSYDERLWHYINTVPNVKRGR
jgi:hypothetical protein